MTKNKDQHYVSAFYLYNFTNEEQKSESKGKPKRETKIHHYDFGRKWLRERPIKNLAIKPYLFSQEGMGLRFPELKCISQSLRICCSSCVITGIEKNFVWKKTVFF